MDRVLDEKYRGHSCYFYNHERSRDCCVVGQANTFRNFRMSASLIILVLVVLLVSGGPTISHLVQQLQAWFNWYHMRALCITVSLVAATTMTFLLSKAGSRYNEANSEVDIRFYYFVGVLLIIALPLINCTYIAGIAKLRSITSAANRLSVLPKCPKPSNLLRITVISAIIVYALQLYSLLGYGMVLAAVAAPVYSIPLLLMYACYLYVYVIIFAELLKLCYSRKCLVLFFITYSILSYAFHQVLTFVCTRVESLFGPVSYTHLTLPTIYSV